MGYRTRRFYSHTLAPKLRRPIPIDITQAHAVVVQTQNRFLQKKKVVPV